MPENVVSVHSFTRWLAKELASKNAGFKETGCMNPKTIDQL